MYSNKYTQCGFPQSGWGLNLSKGTDPYTTIPKNEIYVNTITLGETTYDLYDGFETMGEFFQYLNDVFVPFYELGGYFFTNQYKELVYSNSEEFDTGLWELISFEEADSEYDLNEYYPGEYQ